MAWARALSKSRPADGREAFECRLVSRPGQVFDFEGGRGELDHIEIRETEPGVPDFGEGFREAVARAAEVRAGRRLASERFGTIRLEVAVAGTSGSVRIDRLRLGESGPRAKWALRRPERAEGGRVGEGPRAPGPYSGVVGMRKSTSKRTTVFGLRSASGRWPASRVRGD